MIHELFHGDDVKTATHLRPNWIFFPPNSFSCVFNRHFDSPDEVVTGLIHPRQPSGKKSRGHRCLVPSLPVCTQHTYHIFILIERRVRAFIQRILLFSFLLCSSTFFFERCCSPLSARSRAFRSSIFTQQKGPYLWYHTSTYLVIKIKIHSSCEIEYFVQTHLCKLCVILSTYHI